MATEETSTAGLAKLSEILGAPEPAIRLLCSILLGFPLALIHRYSLYGKHPTLQHLFFTAGGLCLGYWNWEWEILHSTVALVVTYLTLVICGGTVVSVVITFLFNMGYLLLGYYSTSTEEYDIKWTMPHCVLTLRLIGLAFDMFDGRKPAEKQSAIQKETALREMPSFLEVASFVYFPGSFLVGPQFSMRRFLDYVNGLLIDSEPSSESGVVKLPNCLLPGILRATVGFIYVAAFQVGTLYVSDQYLLEPDFHNDNFFKRCFLLGLWGRVNLYKYMSCWLITEGVCIVFGLTYNGKDKQGTAKWDGCANVKLLIFENATQFNHYIMSFNINTNHWCAEYVYKRLRFLGSRTLSQVATLLFLAVWHGFHSGYYLCFFMEFIIMYFEKDFGPVLQSNEKLQKYLQNPVIAILVWVVMKLYTFVFMGYSLIPFVLLSYPKYVSVFGSFYFVGHVIFMSYPLLAPFLKPLIGQRARPHVE